MKNNIIYKAFGELFTASKVLFVASYLFTLLQGLARILPIITLQYLFDEVIAATETGVFTKAIWFLFAFIGARILCHVLDLVTNYLYEYYNMIAGKGMAWNVNRKVFESPAIDFEKTDFLEKINKAYRGTGSIRRFIDTWMMILLLYIPEILVIVLYLFQANVYLPLILLLIAIPEIIVVKLQEKEFSMQEEKVANIQRKIDIYNDLTFGIRSNIETKILGYEELLVGKTKNCVQEKSQEEYVYQVKKNQLENMEKLVILLGYITIFVVLVLCAYKGMITIGVLAALVTSLEELFQLMEMIVATIAEGVSEELEKIRNYFKVIEGFAGEKEGKEKLSSVEEIEFCHVSFSYPNCEAKALDDVSFYIKAGESIAIVGENGSGKSTLIKLISGIYDCTEGEILYNGKAIRQYARKSVLEKITGIFQNFGRYALTINENICLASGKDEDRLWKIKQLKGLEKIEDISQEEILSREFDGIDLSGGQWQRIAIARGQYKEGEVYVLDEPTSAIDPNEEKTIYELFREITKGKTSFLVTHRMGAVSIAKKIIVMSKGKICGIGTHGDLLKECEEYKCLWESQALHYQGCE